MTTPDFDALRAALHAATASLESIAEQAGRTEWMADMIGVRAYAGSRALAAWASLATADAALAQQPTQNKVWQDPEGTIPARRKGDKVSRIDSPPTLTKQISPALRADGSSEVFHSPPQPAPAEVPILTDAQGWQWVPVEPTPEMVEAVFIGAVEPQCYTTQHRARERMAEYYRAMLAAAPTPPPVQAVPAEVPTAAERERNKSDAKDAARYQMLRRDFSPMGLDANGNHAWVYRRNFSLKGPTLDAAVDAAMKKEPKP